MDFSVNDDSAYANLSAVISTLDVGVLGKLHLLE